MISELAWNQLSSSKHFTQKKERNHVKKLHTHKIYIIDKENSCCISNWSNFLIENSSLSNSIPFSFYFILVNIICENVSQPNFMHQIIQASKYHIKCGIISLAERFVNCEWRRRWKIGGIFFGDVNRKSENFLMRKLLIYLS